MKDIEIYYNDKPMDIKSIPIPLLCVSCKNNDVQDEKCVMTRLDQLEEIRRGDMFCCFAYEPVDPSIDKKQKYREMEDFLKVKSGGNKRARVEDQYSHIESIFGDGFEIELNGTDDVTDYVRTGDSKPVHDPKGLKLNVSREKQVRLCLNVIFSILEKEQVGLLVTLADRAVSVVGIVPYFSYMDTAQAMEKDDRFVIEHMQICALKGMDPVRLLAERDVESSIDIKPRKRRFGG